VIDPPAKRSTEVENFLLGDLPRSRRRRCARCLGKASSTSCCRSASGSTRSCRRSSTSRPSPWASRSPRSRSRTSRSPNRCSARSPARPRQSARRRAKIINSEGEYQAAQKLNRRGRHHQHQPTRRHCSCATCRRCSKIGSNPEHDRRLPPLADGRARALHSAAPITKSGGSNKSQSAQNRRRRSQSRRLPDDLPPLPVLSPAPPLQRSGSTSSRGSADRFSPRDGRDRPDQFGSKDSGARQSGRIPCPFCEGREEEDAARGLPPPGGRRAPSPTTAPGWTTRVCRTL